MNNTQLLLSIGIPSLMVVLSWINNNSRFDRIERRLDTHEQRFDDILASNHKDALEIMKAMTALHERVAIVEARQAS